jgi:outer membrane protein assembly factor BamB
MRSMLSSGRNRALLAALAVPAAVAAASGARSGARISPAPLAPVLRAPARTIAGWPKYCRDAAMTGYADSESRISPSTASGLSPLWSLALEAPIASSPSVEGDRLYIGDWSGRESAVAADSGNVLAQADLGVTRAPQCNPAELGITSAPLLSGGRVYVAGGDDSFYCLDGDTLAVLWKTALGDNSESGGYYGWCSPALANGLILQGVSSNCDNPFIAGKLVALSRENGSIVEETNLSLSTDPTHFGSGVWTSPAVDTAAGDVFVTTGSAYHYDDGYAFSIVRLSLPNLTPRDSWRVRLDHLFDADWGSSPTLFRDSSGRDLVGASQKDGSYYAFLRGDLAGGPVWTARIARSGDCPQCGDGALSTAAFDGARLYAGGGALEGLPPGSLGSVVAIDPASGAILWRSSGFDGPVIAPVSSANGVVFAVGGHVLAAMDAGTGAVLWSFRMKAQGYGGVAISAGRIFVGDLAGNLYAFGLP